MIYLDHAAATPVSDQALAAMQPFFQAQFFNPSSPYDAAKHVRDVYEDHKNRLAHLIGAKGNDLVITSGATEANNLAFTAFTSGKILILATEHDSVFAAAKAAVKTSTNAPVEVAANISAEVATAEAPSLAIPANRLEIISVDTCGRLDLADLREKLTPDVSFISISLANGELGTIQPLAEVAELVKTERLRRLENGESLPLIFHSDASQTLNLLNISVSRLGVDLLTLNSAKVGGPKGVGALYVGRGVKLRPLVAGGGQELGLRAGTENVAGLVGFTIAAEEAQKHLASNRKKYAAFQQIFREELLKSPVKPIFLGLKQSSAKLPKPSDHQLASFCPVAFPGIDAERLIYLLEDPSIFIDATAKANPAPSSLTVSAKTNVAPSNSTVNTKTEPVYLSTGAACAASKGRKSRTFSAIGLSDAELAGSLRISFGSTNDESQIRHAAKLIIAAIQFELTREKRGL